jgi:hypothetical protein
MGDGSTASRVISCGDLSHCCGTSGAESVGSRWGKEKAHTQSAAALLRSAGNTLAEHFLTAFPTERIMARCVALESSELCNRHCPPVVACMPWRNAISARYSVAEWDEGCDRGKGKGTNARQRIVGRSSLHFSSEGVIRCDRLSLQARPAAVLGPDAGVSASTNAYVYWSAPTPT